MVFLKSKPISGRRDSKSEIDREEKFKTRIIKYTYVLINLIKTTESKSCPLFSVLKNGNLLF